MTYTLVVWFAAVYYHHYFHWSYLSVSLLSGPLVLAVLWLAGRWLGTRPAEEPWTTARPEDGGDPARDDNAVAEIPAESHGTDVSPGATLAER